MSRRHSTIVGCLLSALLLAPIAQADGPRDAFVLVAADAETSQELAEDVTEAVGFSLAQEKDLDFVPKEAILLRIGYTSPDAPGTCLFDNECLRKLRAEMKLRRMLVGRLKRLPDGFRVTIVRVAERTASDQVFSRDVPDAATDVINAARALVAQALKAPIATFAISVSEPDAVVHIGGKKVGEGSVTVRVKPGAYLVRVSKPGFVPFEARLECAADKQCIVPVNLARPAAPAVTPPTADVPRWLRIGGWSAAGVGAVLVTVGAIYGVRSADAQSELDAACAAQPCSIDRATATALRDKGETGAAVMNGAGITGSILLVGGVAAAVVGHVWRPRTGASVEVSVLPGVGLDPGATVHLRF